MPLSIARQMLAVKSVVITCIVIVAQQIKASEIVAAPLDDGRESVAINGGVQVLRVFERHSKPLWTYVITHGMGERKSGDRFDRLADQIRIHKPDCDVWIVDWSCFSSRKLFGIPAPWLVARRIDAVGDCIAATLLVNGIQPDCTTLIGESFGNNVNARISIALDGRPNMLVFNPANEMGGYFLDNLADHTSQAWSFHTYSPLDSQSEIADADFLLESDGTPSVLDQHTCGIEWLTELLASHNLTWLDFAVELPARKPASFRGVITRTGNLIDQYAPRTPSTRPTAVRHPG